MHALVRRIDSQVVTPAALKAGEQRVSLVAGTPPASAHVSSEVVLFPEGGHDRLAKARWLTIYEIARGNEGPHN